MSAANRSPQRRSTRCCDFARPMLVRWMSSRRQALRYLRPKQQPRASPSSARALGLQIQIFNASTSPEIDAAFATLVRARPHALFVGSDSFFTSRRIQLVNLAARHALPATFAQREFADVGGLMSYGTNLADVFRQVGVYTGRILKGGKPVDLPVMQSSKFELVINHQTARLLDIAVPSSLLATADEVIE